MRKSKLELENQLFDLLSGNQTITMLGMMRALECKKENLQGIIKQYEKTDTNPLGLIKINKKNIPYEYSLETTSYDELHNHLETYLKGTNQLVQHLMKQLKKPLFKDVKEKKLEQGGNSLSFEIQSEKARGVMTNISLQLSHIHQVSFLLTYYKTLNQIPKGKLKQADYDQELCVKTYSDIVMKLREFVGRREAHQKALESMLFTHQMTLRGLDLHH
ncbi:MAG: hypothetical protein H8D35_00655 [Nitrosopumilus sp.]|nr:hypothetical protein [Nitrosopumilus sp.]